MTYFYVNYVTDQAVIENMYKPHDKNAFFNLLYIYDIVYPPDVSLCKISCYSRAKYARSNISVWQWILKKIFVVKKTADLLSKRSNIHISLCHNQTTCSTIKLKLEYDSTSCFAFANFYCTEFIFISKREMCIQRNTIRKNFNDTSFQHVIKHMYALNLD